MVDILHEVDIHAPSASVYAAITQQNGLAGWWTALTRAQPKVGTLAEFGFDNWNFVIKMEISQLDAGKRVEWKPLSGAPDWGGTVITWDLTPIDKGTKVVFGHRNYASTGGSYASVNFEWGKYLYSLKSYLETGKGIPNTM
jgi:uncharacterized protein YndB with AHSA1/START domain